MIRIFILLGFFLFPHLKSWSQKKSVKKANPIVAPFGFTFGQNELEFNDKARLNNALPKSPYLEPGFRDMRRIVFPVLGMPMGSRKAKVYGLLLNNRLCQLKVSVTEDSLVMMKELNEKYGAHQSDTVMGQNRRGYRWQFDNGYLLVSSEFRNEFFLTFVASDLYNTQLNKMSGENAKPNADSTTPKNPKKDW